MKTFYTSVGARIRDLEADRDALRLGVERLEDEKAVLREALRCLVVEIEYLTEDGTLEKSDVDSNASVKRARAALAASGGKVGQ